MSIRPALLLAALALTACESSKPDHLDPTSDTTSEAELAERIEASKKAARDAAVADVYDEWTAAAAEHRALYRETLEASLERRIPTGLDPVRSLDELRAEADPLAHDPELRALSEAWQATCLDYVVRLRRLGNDPTADPRSPLRAGE